MKHHVVCSAQRKVSTNLKNKQQTKNADAMNKALTDYDEQLKPHNLIFNNQSNHTTTTTSLFVNSYWTLLLPIFIIFIVSGTIGNLLVCVAIATDR